MSEASVIAGGAMRPVDFVYAAAIVALFVWLALGAPNGLLDLGAARSPTRAPRALAPVSAPGAAAPAAWNSPKVAARATIDSRQFEILVGEGPPPWGVAVSVDD
jgi:hypothetical protein